MKNKKARTATIMLITLWLLSGISIVSNAENIPISEDGLKKIGFNKVRMENGIGVIVFNLSETTDRLMGNGYLTVSNTFNSSVTISCQLVTKLSIVDLDENGSYRIHKKISDFIVFHPFPNPSWITFEDTKATIEPYSIYNFRYKVDIPLDEAGYLSNDTGYLMYIHIVKDLGKVTGANIGIDYNYKLFLVFTGEIKEEQKSSINYLLYIGLFAPICFVTGTFIIYKKKKAKNVNIVSNANTVYTNPTDDSKTSDKNPVLNEDIIHHRVDELLGGKNV